VRAAAAALRGALPGLDLGSMVERDPGLLLEVDIESALAAMGGLWELDAAAVAQSEPAELALALRALARSAPARY